MTNDSLNKLLDKTLDELCKMTPDEVFDFSMKNLNLLENISINIYHVRS